MTKRKTEIFNSCMSNRTEWWEIDRGYFNAQHFGGYYRISLNGLRASFGLHRELPGDRFGVLRKVIKPWQKGNHILVCPPTEAVWRFYNFKTAINDDNEEISPVGTNNWTAKVIEEIKQSTDRTIIIRRKNSHTPIEQDLYNCHCVVTYNSNVAVDALLNGVPAFTFSEEIPRNYHLNKIESDEIYSTDRERVFNFLAYCQFTLKEFESGYAWRTAQEVQKYA
jgi:hypothetical protein